MRGLTFLLAGLLLAGVDFPAGRKVPREYAPDQIIIKFRGQAADALEQQVAQKTPVSRLTLSPQLDTLNTKYRAKEIKPLFKGFKKNRQRLESLKKKDKSLLTKKEKHILRRLKRAPKDAKVPDLSRIYKITFDLGPGQSIEQVAAAYNNLPDIEYAELNYIVSIGLTPNDPLYHVQWPLNNIGQLYPSQSPPWQRPPPGTPDCDVDAPEAWDVNSGSSEIIVAVVDTGTDYGHRDLHNNMWVNQEELAGEPNVDDDGNGYFDDIYGYDFCNDDGDPQDDHGHGTHCAGIIAAEGDNGLDITGVCWNGRIMPLKFLNWYGIGTTDDAVNAIKYAADNGADVMSNSWGGGPYSEVMKEAIDYAHSQGVIMVAAAGNSNSNSPEYPAGYEHVIAVAATDSDDQKAPFSNYGDWVDIAAPGVDVLSLRAAMTAMGTTYDDYTTIASGTSMACPHVAGACGLLLAVNPTLTPDKVFETLMDTVDPILPGICRADGRLNLLSAVLAVGPSKGYINLDHEYYSCAAIIFILLADGDLAGVGSQEVTITTNGPDSETVLLTEDAFPLGVFTGAISTSSDDPNTEDGTVQVAHGQIITAWYYDANDGTGNPATAADTAIVDCAPPTILNVQFDQYPVGPEPTVIVQTDEPTIARVSCGPDCGEPNLIIVTDSTLETMHTIRLAGVLPETNYFFIVEANDAVGNATADSNAGQCYAFTTDGGPADVCIPEQYSTIQEAIGKSWNGGTVWVADGVYTGEGNRDIDFEGRAITVRSRNGPANCVIDCQGSQIQSHRGFYFHSEEDANSVLAGLTITNGYVRYGEGGAIKSSKSSPTIDNCIIRHNVAGNSGGGIYCYEGSLAIINCTVTGNSTIFSNAEGGGMHCVQSNPTITNCTFTDNTADNGGGMANSYGDPNLTDCIFTGNTAYAGGGMGNYYGDPTLINCRFSNNTASGGGGMHNSYGNLTLTNCCFSGNSAIYDSGGMCNSNGSSTLTNCKFSGNSVVDYSAGGIGNYWSDATLTNCTITGNSGGSKGGGMYNQHCTSRLTNCILWGNTAASGPQIALEWNSVLPVSYCDIQGGQAAIYRSDSSIDWGSGNIDDDPLLMDTNGADNMLGTEDDNPRLLPGSPCVDAGDNSAVPPSVATDLDGNPRVINGTVDMGSYEGPKNGFLLSTESITVPEGQMVIFTVSLAADPLGIVQATVANQSGDPDITVQSGASLTFNSSNYSIPQPVTLAAAEDGDNLDGATFLSVSAAGFFNAGVTANEEDNEPAPTILFVDASAQGANYASSWANAFTDLQEALSVAAAFADVVEQIHVAQGIYRPAGPSGDRKATFQLISNVGIYGGFPPGGCQWDQRDPHVYETVLSGDLNNDDGPDFANYDDNSYHVVTGSGADETAVLDGFIITAGNANGFYTNGDGGGMYNYSFMGVFPPSSPTVTNCTFRHNSAIYGGGVYNCSNLMGATSDSSTAAGIRLCPALTNCNFSGNSARYGAGMFNISGSPELTKCTFTANSAELDGGGIYNYYGNPHLTNCTFSRNTARYGAGMAIADSRVPTLTNCTFHGNSATSCGGIYYLLNMYPTLTNSILWGNSDGGGMDESAQIAGDLNYLLAVNYNCIQGWTGDLGGTGNIGLDPNFVDGASGDYHLQSEAGRWDSNSQAWVIDANHSLCIDAGDPNSDWTAELWPHGKRINMGAYGGTPEASMSLSTAGNIADLDDDGDVDYVDLDLFTDEWTSELFLLAEDLDRNGLVDFPDFAIFASNWPWEE